MSLEQRQKSWPIKACHANSCKFTRWDGLLLTWRNLGGFGELSVLDAGHQSAFVVHRAPSSSRQPPFTVSRQDDGAERAGWGKCLETVSAMSLFLKWSGTFVLIVDCGFLVNSPCAAEDASAGGDARLWGTAPARLQQAGRWRNFLLLHHETVRYS